MSRTVSLLFAFALAAVGCGPEASGQEAPGDAADALTSPSRSLHVSARPLYQRYQDGSTELSEWSLPLQVRVPFGERWQARLRGSVASVQRPNGATVTGLGDVQAALSYARKIGESSVIVSASANLPMGTDAFSRPEFATVTLLSQNIYDFQMSGFGQGPGGLGGITWVYPIGEDLVLGLGGSYQIQGGYTPVAGMADSYEPGNQGLATGGLEVRLSRTSSLSVNASVTLYGTDMVGETARFEAGPKSAVEVQYYREWGYNTLRLTAGYEGRGQSTRPAATGEGLGQQVLPDRTRLRGHYGTRLTDVVDVAVWGEGRTFGETVAHDRETIAVVGARASIEIGEGFTLAPEVSYTAGTFTGLAGGATVEWSR